MFFIQSVPEPTPVRGSSQPIAAPSCRPRGPHGNRVCGQLRRLPLADDPVVDLNHTPELPVNLEPITDVR